MKRLVLAAGTVAMMAVTGTAQTAGTFGRDLNAAPRPMPKMTENMPTSLGVIPGKNVARTQAGYSDLYQPDVRPYFVNYMYQPSIAHDPKTNTTVVYRADLTFTAGNLSGANNVVYVTTDDGANWLEVPLNTGNERGSVFGAIALVNTDNSVTDPEALPWFTYSRGVSLADGAWEGGYWYWFDGSSPNEYGQNGPVDANPQGYLWGLMDMTSSNSPAAVYSAGLLQPQTGSQYGTYGNWGFDFDAGDFTSSGIPSQFKHENFRPSPAPSSSYQGPMYVGTDEDGRLYACVNNIFADDIDNRVTAISTSDDQGATWSAWNRMPNTVWDEYAVTRGGASGYSVLPYEQDGFAVTGSNKASYITRAAVFNSAQELMSIDIVEVKYNNGSWSVTGLVPLSVIPDIYERDATNSTDTFWAIEQMNNYTGNETELAITADGKLLLKFIDARDTNWIRFNPPISATRTDNNNVLQPITVDSMLTTDVYMMWRDLTGTEWSEPVNVTNDAKFDKGTHIPRHVKNLSSVPMLQHKGMTNADITNPSSALYEKYPDIILEAFGDVGNTVRVSFINALDPSSVSEGETLNFSLGNVTPNPVTTSSEVVFTLQQPGMVKLAIYDALGNTVSTLIDGTMDAGVHGMTIDASKLPAGSYQYALSVNGRTASKALVVIR